MIRKSLKLFRDNGKKKKDNYRKDWNSFRMKERYCLQSIKGIENNGKQKQKKVEWV